MTAFICRNFHNCILLHVYVLSVRPVSQLQKQLVHEGLLLVVLFKARSNQLWTDGETFDESFGFPNVKHLFIASLLALSYERLLKFPLFCRDTYRTIAIFSWKKNLAIDCLRFLSYIYLFQKDVFTEWWNRRFRGSRKQNFIRCPAMVGRPFIEFFKNFIRGFLQFSGGISVSFLKKESNKSLNFCFNHYQLFSKS